jgi:hypothetical protein
MKKEPSNTYAQMMKRLHNIHAENFKVVKLPLSIHAGVLSLFRHLPKSVLTGEVDAK